MRPLSRTRRGLLALAATIALATPAAAQEEEGGRLVHGDDLYAAGDAASITAPTGRNAFLAGGGVEMEGAVGRDAHVAAFDADIEAPVAGDLYVAAALVSVGAAVTGDATLAAYEVEVPRAGSVGGNLRAMARTVEVDGDVGGSVLVAASTLRLSGTVAGDLMFAGRTVEFGPDARVEGTLAIRAPRVVEVPPSVAAPDRVSYAPLDLDAFEGFGGEAAEGAGEALGLEPPSVLTIVAVAVAGLLALLLVGILFLGLAPRTVEGLREEIETRMWRSLGFGLIGLATLLGLVPLAAITIVGIPLIPVLLPIIALVAAFAWLLGAYTLAHRVFRTFGAGLASMGARLLVFLVGVIVLAGLNAVPVLGWILNGFASLIGFGALQMRLVEKLDRATPHAPSASATST